MDTESILIYLGWLPFSHSDVYACQELVEPFVACICARDEDVHIRWFYFKKYAWLNVFIHTVPISETCFRCAPLEFPLIRLQEVAYQPRGSLGYNIILLQAITILSGSN